MHFKSFQNNEFKIWHIHKNSSPITSTTRYEIHSASLHLSWRTPALHLYLTPDQLVTRDLKN